jgi:hypothetical protein
MAGRPRTNVRWDGSAVTKIRETWRERLPLRCRRCGRMIYPADDWIVGHIKSRRAYPELTWDPANHWPEHRHCSDASANEAKAEAAARELAAAGSAPGRGFSGPGASQAASRLPATHTPGGYPPPYDPPPRSTPEAFAEVSWLESLLEVPADAAWPRYMTPVHPLAVGSYGFQIEEWAASELNIEFRWWQKLAIRRQFEHDKDGQLCWQSIIESTPRRAGKSVRLRAGALWRVEHGAELFGEEQLVMHTGKDLPIAKEIHRRAWPWATARGWTVRKGMGNEELEALDGSRWIVRGRHSLYGYDTTYGMVDEGWGVEPSVVDEGLEPSLLERLSPQLLLTSTAHRKATPLMRRRIESAITGMGEDWDSLLLLWGADPDDPPGDIATWRKASPHWSEARRKLIAGKYERAMRGEADPEAADPDPMEGFRAQYLNHWPSFAPPREKGDHVIIADAWEVLRRPGLDLGEFARPLVAAAESWFAEGASLAIACAGPDGRVRLRIETYPDTLTLTARLEELRPELTVAGKSLARAVVGSEPVSAVTRDAAAELRRLVDERAFVHDDHGELSEQALALRAEPGSEGARIVSRDRADAIKAAVWAVRRAQEFTDTPAIF